MSEILNILEYLSLQSDSKLFIKYWVGYHGYQNKIIAKF